MIFCGPKGDDFLIPVMVDGLEPFLENIFHCLKIHIFRYWFFGEKGFLEPEMKKNQLIKTYKYKIIFDG